MASRSPASRSALDPSATNLPPVQMRGEWDGLMRGIFTRFGELIAGSAAMLLALVLAAMLISFSSADPSYTTAASGPVRNLLGSPGAHVASILLLIAGWPMLLLSGNLAVGGWRLAMAQSRSRRLWRAIVGVMLCAAALSIWENSPEVLTAGRGGVIGYAADAAVDPLAATLNAGGAAALRGVLLLGLGLGGLWLWWRSLALSLPSAGLFARALGWLRERRRPVAALAEPDRDADEERGSAEPGVVAPRRRPVDAGPRLSPEISEPAPAPAARPGGARATQGDMFAGTHLPPLSLLTPASDKSGLSVDKAALERNARLLEGVLEDFKVEGNITAVRQGPVVTMYELEPAPGTKASRVINLADDIARNMSALSARIASIPGRTVIGIELPNPKTEPVVLHQLIASEAFQEREGQLAIVLGKNIAGDPVVADLAPMPHLLIAGTTGSGKSVGLNAMILSLLYRLTPDQCRMILIDPKMLELSVYDGIPHLLAPVVTEPPKAVRALKWAVEQMEDRYRAMANLQVRNLASFNDKVRSAKARGQSLKRQVQTGFDPDTGRPIYEEEQIDVEPMPHIVVIVDELADLMITAGKEVEVLIQRLAQKARAAGIHLILATQRPSVDVITGVIKANLPTRISFHVTSKIDSRTILGEMGAEQLLGKGDMLWMAGGKSPIRVHGPFVSDEEVRAVADHWRAQGAPTYVEAVTEEPEVGGDWAYGGEDVADTAEDRQYAQAVQVVIDSQRASVSSVQRALRIGYNTASRHVDRMEADGIVSSPNHLGRRDVLLDKAGKKKRRGGEADDD